MQSFLSVILIILLITPSFVLAAEDGESEYSGSGVGGAAGAGNAGDGTGTGNNGPGTGNNGPGGANGGNSSGGSTGSSDFDGGDTTPGSPGVSAGNEGGASSDGGEPTPDDHDGDGKANDVDPDYNSDVDPFAGDNVQSSSNVTGGQYSPSENIDSGRFGNTANTTGVDIEGMFDAISKSSAGNKSTGRSVNAGGQTTTDGAVTASDRAKAAERSSIATEAALSTREQASENAVARNAETGTRVSTETAVTSSSEFDKATALASEDARNAQRATKEAEITQDEDDRIAATKAEARAAISQARVAATNNIDLETAQNAAQNAIDAANRAQAHADAVVNTEAITTAVATAKVAAIAAQNEVTEAMTARTAQRATKEAEITQDEDDRIAATKAEARAAVQSFVVAKTALTLSAIDTAVVNSKASAERAQMNANATRQTNEITATIDTAKAAVVAATGIKSLVAGAFAIDEAKADLESKTKSLASSQADIDKAKQAVAEANKAFSKTAKAQRQSETALAQAQAKEIEIATEIAQANKEKTNEITGAENVDSGRFSNVANTAAEQKGFVARVGEVFVDSLVGVLNAVGINAKTNKQITVEKTYKTAFTNANTTLAEALNNRTTENVVRALEDQTKALAAAKTINNTERARYHERQIEALSIEVAQNNTRNNFEAAISSQQTTSRAHSVNRSANLESIASFSTKASAISTAGPAKTAIGVTTERTFADQLAAETAEAERTAQRATKEAEITQDEDDQTAATKANAYAANKATAEAIVSGYDSKVAVSVSEKAAEKAVTYANRAQSFAEKAGTKRAATFADTAKTDAKVANAAFEHAQIASIEAQIAAREKTFENIDYSNIPDKISTQPAINAQETAIEKAAQRIAASKSQQANRNNIEDYKDGPATSTRQTYPTSYSANNQYVYNRTTDTSYVRGLIDSITGSNISTRSYAIADVKTISKEKHDVVQQNDGTRNNDTLSEEITILQAEVAILKKTITTLETELRTDIPPALTLETKINVLEKAISILEKEQNGTSSSTSYTFTIITEDNTKIVITMPEYGTNAERTNILNDAGIIIEDDFDFQQFFALATDEAERESTPEAQEKKKSSIIDFLRSVFSSNDEEETYTTFPTTSLFPLIQKAHAAEEEYITILIEKNTDDSLTFTNLTYGSTHTDKNAIVLVTDENNKVVLSDGTFAPETVDGTQVVGSPNYVYVLLDYTKDDAVAASNAALYANNTSFASRLYTNVVNYLSGNTGSFTLSDITTVTYVAVDPDPTITDEEYVIYTIALTDTSTREVAIPSYATDDERSDIFARSGYSGDPRALIAKSTVASEAPKTEGFISGIVSALRNVYTTFFTEENTETYTDLAAVTITPTDEQRFTADDIHAIVINLSSTITCRTNTYGYSYRVEYAGVSTSGNNLKDSTVHGASCTQGSARDYIQSIVSYLYQHRNFTFMTVDDVYHKVTFVGEAGTTVSTDTTTVVETSTTTADSVAPLNFQVRVKNNNNTVVTDWTNRSLSIASDNFLAFKWDARNFVSCLPFLSDNGSYSLSRGGVTMIAGNTETEGFSIPVRTYTYRIECTESNGDVVTEGIAVSVGGTIDTGVRSTDTEIDAGTVDTTSIDNLLSDLRDESSGTSYTGSTGGYSGTYSGQYGNPNECTIVKRSNTEGGNYTVCPAQISSSDNRDTASENVKIDYASGLTAFDLLTEYEQKEILKEYGNANNYNQTYAYTVPGYFDVRNECDTYDHLGRHARPCPGSTDEKSDGASEGADSETPDTTRE